MRLFSSVYLLGAIACGSVSVSDPDAGDCDGVVDCEGVCNGTAVEDCNGVCDGTAVEDCDGVCDGPAIMACGICAPAGDPCPVVLPDSETPICNDGNGTDVPCPADPQGQDGNVRIGVPSYVVNGDTVTDSVTGLVWELNPPYADAVFATSVARCDNLNLGGENDWRLPNYLELVSLIDAGQRGPAWPVVFVGIPQNSFFWVTDLVPGTVDISYASSTNFATFATFGHASVNVTTIDRCVRGADFAGDLVAAGNTVIDERTNLVWESGVAPATVSWVDALTRCENLSLDGADNWRLPSIKELASIVDVTQSNPAISPLFAARPATLFWSSTPTPLTDDAFVINFTNGDGILNEEFVELRDSRCVRSRTVE